MRLGLLALAVLCFVVQTLLGLFDGSSGRLNLTALGLTFFAASFIAAD